MASKNKKKVVAPKPAKVAKPMKNVIHQKVKIGLIEFSVSAVIPTQQYGNIQPKITVTAPSIEEARTVVMPVIEDLYKTYAEEPLNGKTPKFLGKITETIKEVIPAQKMPVMPPSTGKPVPAPHKPETSPVEAVDAPEAPKAPLPEPVLKAEKAISLATSAEALFMIQEQIMNSVKIPQDFKPDLITKVLKRRNEFK